MQDLDPETRRNLQYAALPGKAVSGFVVVVLCLFVGLFCAGLFAYVWGAVVRHFWGGF